MAIHDTSSELAPFLKAHPSGWTTLSNIREMAPRFQHEVKHGLLQKYLGNLQNWFFVPGMPQTEPFTILFYFPESGKVTVAGAVMVQLGEDNELKAAKALRQGYIDFLSKWYFKGSRPRNIDPLLSHLQMTSGVLSVPTFLSEYLLKDLNFLRKLSIDPFGFEAISWQILTKRRKLLNCLMCCESFESEESTNYTCPHCGEIRMG